MSEAPTIKQRRNTMYDNMEFPPYQYREFPQAVPVVGGKVQPTPYDSRGKAHPVVIVNSQDELDALMEDGADLTPVNPQDPKGAQRVVTEEDEREALFVRADQLGVKVDKRWSTERIQRAISDAEVI